MIFVRPPRIPNARCFPTGGQRAFSLVEILVVVGIAMLLMAVIAPALTRTGGVTHAAYSLQGALDQARTYAVANNTYTWVGVFEEDGAAPSGSPASSGVGRVVLCIVASQDGTAIYNSAVAEAGTTQELDPQRLTQVGPLIKLEGVHILNASGTSVGKRPAGLVNARNLVGLDSTPPLFTFPYPLSSTPDYRFGSGPSPSANGIIQFNPQGEAISGSGPASVPATNLEISLQPAQGNQATGAENLATLLVSGITGQTSIYRP